MEDWVGRDFEAARRCLQAMVGEDEDTQRALQRAAGRYALKALGLIDGEADGYAVASPSSRHCQGTTHPTGGARGCA